MARNLNHHGQARLESYQTPSPIKIASTHIPQDDSLQASKKS